MKAVIIQSREVMAKHARSFRWASWFLPSECRDDAAVVYAFCRLIDDIADETEDTNLARVELEVIRLELSGVQPARPLVAAFLEVASRTQMNLKYADELIEGVLSDLGRVKFETDAQLLRYSYRVAGTVGLMMCPIIGVQEGTARAHAIDLGVAMQLTNICRDVLEDAQRQRIYLPVERLNKAGVDVTRLLSELGQGAQVSMVVRDVLQMAESYYRSAEDGMRFIPARTRFAILVASRLYRAIGLRLLLKGANPMSGRTWIGTPGKLYWVVRALFTFVNRHTHMRPHDTRLHRPLAGLPDVNL